MSGFMFGLIIGYLSWFVFRPNETDVKIPIQKIGALLAVVGGATILALFPTGTILFEYYSIGLAMGFFFTPVQRWARNMYSALAQIVRRARLTKKIKIKKERNEIEDKWLILERVINHKLEESRKIDERYPSSRYIDLMDLQELQYSVQTIEHIMQRFAQDKIYEGVEYRLLEGKPALFKKKW